MGTHFFQQKVGNLAAVGDAAEAKLDLKVLALPGRNGIG